MEQLAVLRQKIDEIDQEIQRLFLSRMETVKAIAEFKIANDLSVYDRSRETAVIDANVSRIAASEYADYYRTVLECVMQVSKEYQKAIVRSTL